MKLLKIFLFFLGIILLFGLSDFIYFYGNEPGKFGKFYLYFALNEAKKGNLKKTVQFLDRAASFHLKQNEIIYKDLLINRKIESNVSGLTDKTKKKLLLYLSKSLPGAIKKNSAPILSNVYYTSGLLVYKDNFHTQANSLFLGSISLDPELGHLYIEAADSYFIDGNINRGKAILSHCRYFNWPNKQCQEYTKSNVNSNSFLPVGIYEKAIYQLQKKYF